MSKEQDENFKELNNNSNSNEQMDRKAGRKFWVIIPDWQFRIIDAKFQFTIYAYFGGLACLSIGIVAYWTKDITNYIVTVDFLFLVLSLAVSFLIFAAVLSHKLIGPIYNLKNHLNRAHKSGKLDHIKFRKDDFFLDLAEEYNAFIEYLLSKK
jgi:methyl-accepting chemotaxis protein